MRRGWWLLLAVFLMVWEPMRIAAEFASAAGTLGVRGPLAIAELLAHALVAVACVAAGWALWNGNPAGATLAQYAVAASAAVSVQSLYWSMLPHQTVPGERLPFATLALAHATVWIVFLKRWREPGTPNPEP